MSLFRLLTLTKRILLPGTAPALLGSLLFLPFSVLMTFAGLQSLFTPYALLILIAAGSVAFALQLACPLAAYGMAALGEKPRLSSVLRFALGRAHRLVPMIGLLLALLSFGPFVLRKLLGKDLTTHVAFVVVFLLFSARYLLPASASAVLESQTTFFASFSRASRLGRGNFVMLLGAAVLQLATLWVFWLAAGKLGWPGWSLWLAMIATGAVTQALAAAAYADCRERSPGTEEPEAMARFSERRGRYARHLAALGALLLLPALPLTLTVSEKTGAELLKWSMRHHYTFLLKPLAFLGAHVSSIEDAAFEGKTEEIKILIAMGENVNARRFDGYTPLVLAAKHNHPEIVRLLLDAGANVNAETEEGHTALTEAAAHGDARLLMLLLKAGANPKAKNQDWGEETPLIFAAKRGDAESVRVLIESGADVNAMAGFGETALMYVAQHGDLRNLEALLAAGADVNAAMNGGWTALVDAARTGGARILKVLLRAGADPNAVYADVNKDSQSVLMVAVQYGEPESVDALLQAGADVNAQRSDGWTALMIAVASGDVEKVRLLLAAGADPLEVDESGATALRMAHETGQREIEQMLRAATKVTPHPKARRTP